MYASISSRLRYEIGIRKLVDIPMYLFYNTLRPTKCLAVYFNELCFIYVYHTDGLNKKIKKKILLTVCPVKVLDLTHVFMDSKFFYYNFYTSQREWVCFCKQYIERNPRLSHNKQTMDKEQRYIRLVPSM